MLRAKLVLLSTLFGLNLLPSTLQAQELERRTASAPAVFDDSEIAPPPVPAYAPGPDVAEPSPSAAEPAAEEEPAVACEPCDAAAGPSGGTVMTLDERVNVIVGGAVVADFVFATARPISTGTPFLLGPDSPNDFEQDTFDAHARQSSLFALVSGPPVGDFQTSALFLANFYDVSVVADQYGFLPLEAWADLKNEDWRFAAGLQFDIFNPQVPTVLPFSLLVGSGNTGNAYRGQARVVRYLYPADDTQVTLQAGLSEPISTFFDPNARLSEDNGWPNVEGRVALGLGPKGPGPLGTRPFEIGTSGIVGQVRNTVTGPPRRIVADVWGGGVDLRWAITERFGVVGEAYVGEGLGTYGGSILATVNPVTFEGIRSGGGFGEVYYYICPNELHTHVGYGIDDPADGDLAVVQPLRNETLYANLLWDVSTALRVGLEVAVRKTAYRSPVLDNEAVTIHTQVRYKF